MELHANWMELVLWRVVGITVDILQSRYYRTLFYWLDASE